MFSVSVFLQELCHGLLACTFISLPFVTRVINHKMSSDLNQDFCRRLPLYTSNILQAVFVSLSSCFRLCINGVS